MRVVQVGPYPPPHGGVETNLVAIRQYLRQHGLSCAAINITRYRKTEADEVYYPDGALELIWDLFRRRYDIIHLHIGGKIPTRVMALALACTTVPWAKSVLTLHSGGFPTSPEGKAATGSSLLGFVLRRFTRLIAVNREIVEFYVRLGVDRSRTRLILPHAVALSQVADALPEPLASFFAQHDPVLIAVCGLEPEYDLPCQIEAMQTVLEKHPNAGLVMAGRGSLEAELRELIAGKPYAASMLLCGDVPHDITLRAIIESDILLRTTLYDGDAISVREALYLGTPVIATDNGMRPPGVNLIPIGDRSALAESINNLVQAAKPVTRIRETDEANLAAVLALYREALAQ